MIGVSGVRGVIGKSLTPELITRFAMAFGTYLRGGTVLVGRDTRVSGAMVKHSVFAGLIATGCQIIDLDIATTPSCSLSIVELGADGGIVISGSHNPVEWNALKFFRSDGIRVDKPSPAGQNKGYSIQYAIRRDGFAPGFVFRKKRNGRTT